MCNPSHTYSTFDSPKTIICKIRPSAALSHAALLFGDSHLDRETLPGQVHLLLEGIVKIQVDLSILSVSEIPGRPSSREPWSWARAAQANFETGRCHSAPPRSLQGKHKAEVTANSVENTTSSFLDLNQPPNSSLPLQ